MAKKRLTKREKQRIIELAQQAVTLREQAAALYGKAELITRRIAKRMRPGRHVPLLSDATKRVVLVDNFAKEESWTGACIRHYGLKVVEARKLVGS